MQKIIDDLKKRGLISQITDEAKLITNLDNKSALYCGFDPTAASLHVGSLLPLITLLRFKKSGSTIIPLIGGSTGMIGDPSGKSAERTLNSEETVNLFKESIVFQIKSILGDVEVLDNNDWTSKFSIIDFLREFGKHFSVNSMLSKESVRNRIDRDDQGISFTEFSYQLLQSMDFWHLFKSNNCRIQIGGSDQWGNITSGMDLIHKKEGNDVVVAGLTMPLLVKSDGTKFGKSESGTVWLSPDKTRPFEFFQFWLKVPDSDIERFFKMLSFKSVEEIDIIIEEDKNRAKPIAQRLLAEELTALVHGVDTLNSVLKVTKALFENKFDDLDAEDFISLNKDGMIMIESEEPHMLELLLSSGLIKSKRQGRELISSGAVLVNGVKKIMTDDEANSFIITDFKNGFAVLQKGKRDFRLIKKV
jgi:tyrosyl-tRNA synthetase